jgi:hypothetical protein
MRLLHTGILVMIYRLLHRCVNVISQSAIPSLHGYQVKGAGRPAPVALRHSERGTCGPGAEGGGCCSFLRNVSRMPPPCPGGGAGANGAPGVSCAGGDCDPGIMEWGFLSQPARMDSNRLVPKKVAANTAVARVSTLEVPRLERKPPVDPMPSPPPSDFCNNTTPIMAATTMR